MWIRALLALVMSLSLMTAVKPASAQAFDPRPVLGQLISAFQNCGPPAAYQVLSPQLFQLIAMQTNGRGCYPAIAAAGPVQNMQVIDQRQFPIGPLFVVRVFHPNMAVDWFIGFNQFTSKVEYLSFQAAQTQTPTISTGPTAPIGGSPNPGGGSPGGGSPPSGGSSGGGDGCDLYPAMCQ